KIVTNKMRESVRVYTYRSEYLMLLRQENADIRLTKISYELGIISEERYEKFEEKIKHIEEEQKRLHKLIIKGNDHVQKTLEESNSTPLKDASRALDLLKRPEISYKLIEKLTQDEQDLPEDVKEQVEIQVKYEGYI